MFSTENEIMQAYKEGKEFGIIDERRRVRLAVEAVPERSVDDALRVLDTGTAAIAAMAWNDCRATILKAIGVHE